MYSTKKPSKSAAIAPDPFTADASKPKLSADALVNLDHGDPTMFEPYWRKMGKKCDIMITGYQNLSYFADAKNLCWFLEPTLEEQIRRLHNVVGNATVDDHYVVVGTGSSQLIQAALYALSDSFNAPNPVNVVAAAPYYSSYSETTDFLRSALFKWAGDALEFDANGPYIEFVTSPNNPDGSIREAVVNRGKGKVVHDLAYYWPQYTAITSPADHDLMLFTFSKCTGHAGSRIGWALVRDKEVAKKMVKFVEVNTIGVSKEAQLRAAKVLQVISDGCSFIGDDSSENFFEYGRRLMNERWNKLREVVSQNEVFGLPDLPLQYCNFTGQFTESHPGFAWMNCQNGSLDCAKLLREHKILTRSGERFGSGVEYVRISMLCKDEEFDLFLNRLSTLSLSP